MSDFDDGPFSMDIDREPIFLASDGWGDWYERNDRLDYAPGEIWQTHVPWDKTRRFDMPTYEDFGAMTLYRGTSIKVSPSEFESLWDGVLGGMPSRISTMGTEILSRHLSGGLGKSWSTDINVAYDFSSVTNDNDYLVGVVMQADWEGGSHDKQRNLSDWNFMVHQESEIQLDYGTQVSVTHIGFRMDGMSHSDVVMVPVSPRQFTTSVQGSIDDIMDLLGPSVAPFEPSSQEVSRPAPPTVRDTTSEANVWLPTSVAAHYREYDRSGPAVDELEALIARDGLLTPIRISTDGEVAVVHEGNHRLQVAERLGISEVPAIVTLDSRVVSNGGRVTHLEPVLGSWVEQNRGRLRSFWGQRIASDYFMDHRPAGPDYGGPMHDVSDFFPDIETLPTRMYDFGEPGSQGSIRQIIDAQGNPNKSVTIYRAVPKGADPVIRNGDWVTISREYAEQHGMSNADGNYDVLSATVSASDIWTDGNSVNEWGYHGPNLRTARTYTAEWQPWHSDDQEEAQEIAPGTTIYRGMKVDFSDSDFDQIWRWQQPPLVEEERGQHFKIGPFILDRLEPLGIHWTTKRRIAEIGASQGGYGGAGVIIEAEYTGTGQDLRGTAYHNDGWSVEEEITMIPGAQVRITGVFLTGIEKNKNLLRGPELRSAHRTAGTLPPGLRLENPKPNQVVAYDDDNPDPWLSRFGVGVLSWDDNGIISWVAIQDDSYKRRGIATAMLEYARTIRSDIRHSDELSESGAGWAQAVGSRTAGTRTDPGGVYRGINVQVLSHDEQQELAEWANSNSFSLYDYQLAEPNYELVYRILDRLDPGGLGRHWSKDYDVSADFARDQGDGIELILIGHWEGEGVDTREFHRGYDGIQRPSNLPHEEEVTLYPGTPVTLVGMDIVTETGFTYNIPVPNIQVTAGHDMKHLANRTAASDLRVHLFDSEGHEMWLEPDFDGNPWTYHPKVMDAVRYLADVAQEDGVYWHMDHNEFIPSTITDFKVFDGSNDVTHEIKGFPQLRGYYASRTAASTPSAPGILYRGLAVPFSEAQIEDVMEAYGKESFVGRVLGYLSRGFFTQNREWGLGKHWTTNINVAKSFSQNGFGTPVVLIAEWDGSGEDPYNAPGNNFGGEDEVTLLPETELRLVDVLWGPTFESIGGSGRTITAAEPGGVLPWNPSHRGYTWITKTDGTLEAVTNDGVNRMFLHEYPYGWEWEVFDSLGFVEGGTFGMALKGGDALRDRANDLLAEFDTRAERRTRGPGLGYQDDYTQAPNTLWSKRATTSQRYAERLRREGRR